MSNLPDTPCMPSQALIDWINLAVKYVEAGGVGCPKCRDALPGEALHEHCNLRRAAVHAAWYMRDFLHQPAEAYCDRVGP